MSWKGSGDKRLRHRTSPRHLVADLLFLRAWALCSEESTESVCYVGTAETNADKSSSEHPATPTATKKAVMQHLSKVFQKKSTETFWQLVNEMKEKKNYVCLPLYTPEQIRAWCTTSHAAPEKSLTITTTCPFDAARVLRPLMESFIQALNDATRRLRNRHPFISQIQRVSIGLANEVARIDVLGTRNYGSLPVAILNTLTESISRVKTIYPLGSEWADLIQQMAANHAALEHERRGLESPQNQGEVLEVVLEHAAEWPNLQHIGIKNIAFATRKTSQARKRVRWSSLSLDGVSPTVMALVLGHFDFAHLGSLNISHAPLSGLSALKSAQIDSLNAIGVVEIAEPEPASCVCSLAHMKGLRQLVALAAVSVSLSWEVLLHVLSVKLAETMGHLEVAVDNLWTIVHTLSEARVKSFFLSNQIHRLDVFLADPTIETYIYLHQILSWTSMFACSVRNLNIWVKNLGLPLPRPLTRPHINLFQRLHPNIGHLSIDGTIMWETPSTPATHLYHTLTRTPATHLYHTP
ncbi:hypothetical protein NEDG_02045 [Nematocida displodere]|uniref:Uncharacterized protein n=1 Tax=Nematocida displodere TaxID=1805483 RepID=A0A177EJX7_9MICR|nr:hypothetical protein NEDG_02045 [Nematocida displodere]